MSMTNETPVGAAMTDETRETLTKLENIEARRAAYEASNIVAVVSEHGWALGPDPWNSDAYWSAKRAGHHGNIAAALRDVLTPRTCSGCRFVKVATIARGLHGATDVTDSVCAHESETHPLHWCSPIGNADTFGCTYWQAREGEGGGK